MQISLAIAVSLGMVIFRKYMLIRKFVTEYADANFDDAEGITTENVLIDNGKTKVIARLSGAVKDSNSFVLLLPGAGCISLQMYLIQKFLLDKGISSAAIDYSRNDWQKTPTFGDYVNEVTQVLRHFRDVRKNLAVHVCGHSFGGMVGYLAIREVSKESGKPLGKYIGLDPGSHAQLKMSFGCTWRVRLMKIMGYVLQSELLYNLLVTIGLCLSDVFACNVSQGLDQFLATKDEGKKHDFPMRMKKMFNARLLKRVTLANNNLLTNTVPIMGEFTSMDNELYKMGSAPKIDALVLQAPLGLPADMIKLGTDDYPTMYGPHTQTIVIPDTDHNSLLVKNVDISAEAIHKFLTKE